MPLTTPNPSNVHVSFPTRAEFVAASIPADIGYVMAEGLLYVRDSVNGTALTAADSSTWSPHPILITPLHFGAAGDAVTGDKEALQAAIDYCGVLALETPFNTDAKNTYGTRVILDGVGKTYALETGVTLSGSNKNLRMQNMGLVAHDVTWSVDGFMITPGALATYAEFHNIQLNCNDVTGGIKLRARNRLVGAYIEKVKYVGAECAGSDVWIDRCIIGKWTTNSPEYYDFTAYAGSVGIKTTESDARVTSTTVRWLDILVEIESTNNIFSHCHMFNGMKGYTADQRSATGDLKDALDDYWGHDTVADDFTRRAEHIGIQVGLGARASGKSWANSFDQVYFDNCHHELYVDGVDFNHCKWGSKSTSSLNTDAGDDATTPGMTYVYDTSPTINYWINLHAYESNAVTVFQMNDFETFVSSAPRHVIKWSPGIGNWAASTSAITNDTTRNWAESSGATQLANNFTVTRPSTHVYDGSLGPVITYYGMGTDSTLAFADDNTTGAVSIGSNGDILKLLSTAGNIVLEPGPSNYVRLIGLPTSNPGGSDRVWSNAGVLTIT